MELSWLGVSGSLGFGFFGFWGWDFGVSVSHVGCKLYVQILFRAFRGRRVLRVECSVSRCFESREGKGGPLEGKP